LIKKTTGDNPALNTMVHAVLGAAVAQAQGNSAIAGAAGGELAARLITQQLYGTSDTNTLSEEQKTDGVCASDVGCWACRGNCER
ncbi:hypothetical protein Q7O60_30680, partial [Pseudomonas protegens]